ncbi:unnamed protein product [Porites evermanni]|uniref:WW domain containing adaptor with coiled-coil n=1 Tax=Porites evermanni TaxID=104178 RepID=A0ABN8RDU0_9CNID|nr:unnamed protein product [Porites evermanni]
MVCISIPWVRKNTTPKRTSQTRTRSSAKWARVTELIETRPGPSAQQQAETSTEQPLMAVNMQALSASISNAVQQLLQRQ